MDDEILAHFRKLKTYGPNGPVGSEAEHVCRVANSLLYRLYVTVKKALDERAIKVAALTLCQLSQARWDCERG